MTRETRARAREAEQARAEEPEDVEMSDERALVVRGAEEPEVSSIATPPTAVVLPNPTTSTADSNQFSQLTPLGELPILDFSNIVANLPTHPITPENLQVTFMQQNVLLLDPRVAQMRQDLALQDERLAGVVAYTDTNLEKQRVEMNRVLGNVAVAMSEQRK